MKIAIIGGGISGLVCAYKLNQKHDVTVYEANNYPGGHTNTVNVKAEGRDLAIDTGFIVFNDRTYPNFIELLEELGVASQPTVMSFSVQDRASGLEYRGADFDGLFAQRRNIFNLKFLRLLYDLLRFNKKANQLLADENENQTLGEFIESRNFSKQFVKQFLLPMGSAIWSCPFEKFLQFPVRFVAEFYLNHGLLSVADRPQWRVIKGGSREYVKKLIAGFSEKIRLNSPVTQVVRSASGVQVTAMGQTEQHDHVIFACHSDQALRMLGDDASATEKQVLSAFPYEKNTATLHTQEDILPKNRRAWASWNYVNPVTENKSATVTYNMNILQSLTGPKVYCVTLNDEGEILDENKIAQFTYHHPTFDINRKAMQDRHHELIAQNSSSFCGAYWGNGFHEDGVVSALAVVSRLEQWNE